MKSWIVHYKNKYPGCLVQASGDSFDVYKGDEHLVSVAKNGAGQWTDQSEELGLPERHCLAPIPKDSRVYKIRDGKIALDEKASDRRSLSKKFQDKQGKVYSCDELKKAGLFEFDSEQKVTAENKLPEQKEA